MYKSFKLCFILAGILTPKQCWSSDVYDAHHETSTPPLSLYQGAMIGFYDAFHYPQCLSALFNAQTPGNFDPIGIEVQTAKDQHGKYHVWELPEREAYFAIAQSYLAKVKTLILRFDASQPGESVAIFNRYQPLIKVVCQKHPLSLILVGIGRGYIGDLSVVSAFKETLKNMNIVILPWAQKPYQKEYLKNVVFALMRGDQQHVQDVNCQYQNHVKEEQQTLQSIATDLQNQFWQIPTLAKKLANVDYSNLKELLDIRVDDLVRVSFQEHTRFNQTLLGSNMAKLYHIATAEKNEKICHWLVQYAYLFEDQHPE